MEEAQASPETHTTRRIESVALGGAPALGADVRLRLEPERTVLVGKNAAGKSAIIESIVRGFENPLGYGLRKEPPCVFGVTLGPVDSLTQVTYEYSWEAVEGAARQLLLPVDSQEQDQEKTSYRWREKCYAADRSFWELVDGKLRTPGGDIEIVLAPGVSMLELAIQPGELPSHFEFSQFASIVRACHSVRSVRAGVPRERIARRPLLFQNTRGRWRAIGPSMRQSRPFLWLLRSWESDGQAFRELNELASLLGLYTKLEVKRFKPEVSESEDTLASMKCDGVDVGLLSDGTLRTLETLWALLATPRHGLLLLEEPETGIHPGLLNRLLNIVDSYSKDKQIILSTHSPIVVSRAKASELRLVERIASSTSVRELSTNESSRLSAYLEDCGTAGEFVFTGGLDP